MAAGRVKYLVSTEDPLAGMQYTLSILLVYLVCTSQKESTVEVYFI